MATKNPTEVGKKWTRNSTNAQPDYKLGVQNVSVSPTAEAAKHLDKAGLNYQEAISSGRMARRLNAVSREEWIAKTIKLGAERYVTGIAAAEPDMVAFMTDFLPFQATVTDAVRKMSSMSFEDNIQRMVAQARGTHEYKNRR